jgi:ribonucleoside-diphosphate reductase alpha chain/ribonucleoside-triphosphate reductase
MNLLKEEFLSKYSDFPQHMDNLAKLVYYRTYSRWLPDEGRRETWKETCTRAVEYNCSLAPTSIYEAQRLFDNMFNLKQFISGRSLWIGGSEASKKTKLANFNCSFVVIDSIKSLCDLFYLLMVGTGVGVRILPSDVEKLPTFRDDVTLFAQYNKNSTKQRGREYTITEQEDNMFVIKIGDSKEGWVDALRAYLNFMASPSECNNILIDYTEIRVKGATLSSFGGTASGYESIMDMFTKIHNVIQNGMFSSKPENGRLRPIHCLDICNLIGQNVVVGGVRRTAEIAIIDPHDEECVHAKDNIQPGMEHRYMSNNSIYQEEKPSREKIHELFNSIRTSGEPGIINVAEAKRRRSDFAGVNPCAEILLPPNAVCNLTTVNMVAFVNDNGDVDWDGLELAFLLSARAGYRMTCVDLELDGWNEAHHRDRLTGCSMTGWQDFVAKVRPDVLRRAGGKAGVLKWLRTAVHEAGEEIAQELQTPVPLLMTALKPEGSLSLVANGVSPGVHWQHSPYFIRRIRVNAHDPLALTAKELGWQIHPEVGQEMETATTIVIDFPVKSPATVTKADVSAVEQLEEYLLFQKHYTDMNTSNTITVKPDEWEEVEDFVYNHWDDMLGVTFLELNSTYYPLLPYEECTKEEYEELKAKMKEFDPDLLNEKELSTRNMGKEFEILDDRESCASGVCPIR